MYQKVSKGLSAMIVANLMIIILSICLYVFFRLFTYTIHISRIQTIVKSESSLKPLILLNLKYGDGHNLALAIVKDIQIQKEIEDKLNLFFYTSCDMTDRSLCNKYVIGQAQGNLYGCFCKKDYTFRIVFPFPQVYDGNRFVVDSFFESYESKGIYEE